MGGADEDGEEKKGEHRIDPVVEEGVVGHLSGLVGDGAADVTEEVKALPEGGEKLTEEDPEEDREGRGEGKD